MIGASSSFAKGGAWEEKQHHLASFGHPIKCHRPAGFCGTHVSLYYQGFDTFTTECESVSLDASDTKFVMQFCTEMAQGYAKEEDRMYQVRKSLTKYFALRDGRSVQEVSGMDGAVSVNDAPIMIIEGKYEVGAGGCDSYMEVIAHYCNALTKHATDFRAPCFLVEIVGPHIAISGAVKGHHVMVDRLTPFMWMVPQPNDRSAMTQLARVFKALKNALAHLIEFHLRAVPEPERHYPYFREIGDEGIISYLEELKQNVFRCVLQKDGNSERVIVKFVERYGIEAHRLLEKKGYAPSVKAFVKNVTSRYHVIVMEYIEHAVTLYDYILKEEHKTHTVTQLKDHCSEVLTLLHTQGYCHGDLRGNNILVRRHEASCPVVIVDFDWSGKIGEAKYPLFMNHINLKWPDGATDNAPLRPEHDQYWLDKVFQLDSGQQGNNVE